MKNIESLTELFKRDSNGKVRSWIMQYGWDDDDVAGYRTIAGTLEGKKVTSKWNASKPKNIGKVNATNARTQAISEAQNIWNIRIEKEYFEDIDDIDSYDKFEPMLAADYTKRRQDHGYSQPKLDGIRCVANKDGLWTRSGKAILTCNHIWESVKPFLEANPSIVLDGELYNHEYKANFNKITSLVRNETPTEDELAEVQSKVQYHVYDCYNKYDVDMLFKERIQLAASVKSDVVHIVHTDYASFQEELDALYSDYMERGYEGQMVRNDTPYEPNKRSKNLLKRKEFITSEFKVLEMLEGAGNWAGHTKKFRLALEDGTEFGSGVRGNQTQLQELWDTQLTPDWATCRYFELTPDGIPRFPVVIDYGYGVRDD